MFVLDEEKLNLILTEMSEGLAKSPLEIALFCVLVAGIVVSVLILHSRQMRRSREERIERSKRLFHRGVRQRRLDNTDVSLLEAMAAFIDDPGGKHLILENQTIFSTCARKLLQTGQVASASVASLRLKLGFKPRSLEQAFHSTVQLPEDLPVILVQKGGKGCRGRIDRVESNVLCLEVTDGGIAPRRGSPVQIFFQTPSGRFTFSTRVRISEGDRVEATHSENIRRLQRRQFYRKKLMLPVYVTVAGSEKGKRFTTLIDLGGGGASIVNGEIQAQVGDRISLSMIPAGSSKINVLGEVLRVSKGGAVAHIRFDHMSESYRDRIVGLLFKPQKARLGSGNGSQGGGSIGR
jgi:c-di-GMP-binding flagellar brake protein YcgR